MEHAEPCSWVYGLGYLQGLGGLRQVIDHNHFGVLTSRPSDHDDQRLRLRTWEGEGYAM